MLHIHLKKFIYFNQSNGHRIKEDNLKKKRQLSAISFPTWKSIGKWQPIIAFYEIQGEGGINYN
jgi:hypothetical protein